MSTETSQTESTRAVVRQFLDARAANDKEAMEALLTDDAAWYPPPSMGIGPFHGREATVAALGGGAIGQVLDVASIERTVHRIVADGDTAVVLQGLAASILQGGDYRNEYVWVYTCRDGRVARLDEFTDTLYAARAFEWVK
jgi:ketosteroid isomerase-like protein